MDNIELDKLVSELQISKDQILREEAEMLFLDQLGKNRISSKLVFYGGTALRLAYNSPRFSEDIDLLMIGNVSLSELKIFLNTILKKNDNWKLIDIKNKRQILFALINIKDEKLKHNFSIKIEIHKPKKKIDVEYNLASIQSPTSIAQPLLLVPSIEAMKELKIATIKDKKKARDIFDLWFIFQKMREPFVIGQKVKYKENEFKNELQVFLPKKYYPLVKQLYEQVSE
ncbi:MAG: nucleotidyl transferase AbiEii/AbiGii toxin family protein [bacterium]